MELSALARKQKRLKDWLEFIQDGGVQDPHQRSQALQTLESYKRAIAKCWQIKVISPDDERTISDLERRLEQLNEESRMTTIGKRGGQPPRNI